MSGFPMGLMVGIVLTTVIWSFGIVKSKNEGDRLCRHTIQRNFAKSSDEARALMQETEEWESR